MDTAQITTLTEDYRSYIKKFTLSDTAYALLSLVFGVMFVRLEIFTGFLGIGISLFALAVTAAALVRFRFAGRSVTCEGWLWALSAAVFGLVPSMVLTESAMWLSTLIAAVSFLMLCVRGSYASDSGYLLLDLIKALFMPFAHMFSAMPALTVPFFEKNQKSRNIATVVCGIFIALVPTCVVVFLLMRADVAFEFVMDKVLSFILPDSDDLPLDIITVILGVPCGLFIFGAFRNSVVSRETAQSRIGSAAAVGGMKICPPLMCVSVLVPLCLVYAVFFFSQLVYLTSAPLETVEGLTGVAYYARRGFFDLCRVAAVNAAAAALVLMFGRQNRLTKIMLTVLSSFTVALGILALVKMCLYIDCFGLTVNRIYPTVFILLLSVCFVLLIVSLYRPLKFVTLCAVVCMSGVFVTLAFDPDAVVGRYNVGRYLDGTLESVDLHHIEDLSPSASVYLVPLLDDARYGEYAHTILMTDMGRLDGNGCAAGEWTETNVKAKALYAVYAESVGYVSPYR